MAAQMEALLKLNSNKSGGEFMNRLSGEDKISNLKSRFVLFQPNMFYYAHCPH